MSRWLQQQVQPQYPQAKIFEVLQAFYGQSPVSAGTCNSWVSKNGLTHPVLRDQPNPNSVAAILSLKLKEIVVLDRYLKITFKGPVTGPFEQNQVLSALSGIQ